MATQILVVRFKKYLQPHHLPLFRGAMIAKTVKADDNALMHNHVGDGFRYSYPLVQYKLIENNAAIVAINDGIEQIKNIFDVDDLIVNIGNKRVLLKVDDVKVGNFDIACQDKFYAYKILNWLPLNDENYKTYNSIDTLIERCIFLERILIGNILSMLKGLGVFVESEVKCAIQDILDIRIEEANHNVKLLAFDIRFKTNVLLPEFIGLGKQTSLGYGTLYSVKSQK